MRIELIKKITNIREFKFNKIKTNTNTEVRIQSRKQLQIFQHTIRLYKYFNDRLTGRRTPHILQGAKGGSERRGAYNEAKGILQRHAPQT